jgi:guanine deaminase
MGQSEWKHPMRRIEKSPMEPGNIHFFRSSIFHFLDDPYKVGEADSYAFYPDGILSVKDGIVQDVGPADRLLSTVPLNSRIIHYPDKLILPGFVDCHVHYPQTEMIASYGSQLLEWLKTYTFPTEQTFSDPDKAGRISAFFLEELLRNGTTTALVIPTVHKNSVDVFFKAAQKRNLRMICGKVLMDQNAPPALLDTAETGYWDSLALIEKWHGKDRLQYAITPRFAPTCSPRQLTRAGELLKQYPGVYLHTHLSENKEEIAWVASLFPECSGYLDVYDRAGLLGKRSIFAHCIHLTPSEMQRLYQTRSSIAFCPSSNLFLGSGLFKLSSAEEAGVQVGLATDVGAGTSLSMLKTMSDAYKTQQLLGNHLSPFKAFYLATLGGARALDLDASIGNFIPGKEADFVILEDRATPLQALRADCYRHQDNNLSDRLFSLAILGDDRSIEATYILGEPAFSRSLSDIPTIPSASDP